MNVERPILDELREAAEEWQTIAEAARREWQFRLARECEDHANLYLEMATALEKVRRSRRLLQRERPSLREVGNK